MKKFTTILFDMYGVIIEQSKGKFIPYTFKSFDESQHERLNKQFRADKLFLKAGNGEIDSDTFLSLLGFDDPRYHMRDYIENYLTLDAGFKPFAEEFCGKYEFVLLSNDVAAWSEYLTAYHDLNRYFKEKIVSGDVKCRKPDKKIYELALERAGKCPEECIFIDNKVENLLVAQELGIHPILFNRDGEAYDGTIVDTFEELAQILG
ncbi:MAG: HAD-IA family hydrolase [Lachnospiraceae bacterium]|nr:HAD-IA family hydrolase [Lachnospiraceae bacterium]